MTPAERIAWTVLSTYSGPYYVAGTEGQRTRLVQEAARTIQPLLDEFCAAAAAPICAGTPPTPAGGSVPGLG